MPRLHSLLFLAGFALCLASPTTAAKPGSHALIRLTDGRTVEGDIRDSRVWIVPEKVAALGAKPEVRLSDVLSIHLGDSAKAEEAKEIAAAIPLVTGDDREKSDLAAERLVEIGLPAVSAILAALDPHDTDLREPHPLFSLFARIMPPSADRVERNLDMIRMADGRVLRGSVITSGGIWMDISGKPTIILLGTIRRIAMLRPVVKRTLTVHSLRHCTQVEWLDTGILTAPSSFLTSDASGITRLSFDLDIWTATPDGLIQPKETGQKRVIDGFNFGALLGRAGANGERQLLGSHAVKSGLPTGRFYVAINDNGHWQNNIGAYEVKLVVKNAYDVGPPGD
jgi:hypothetical protein